MQLSDSVQYLKGVGEKRAALYQKLGVDTIYSLLHFYPRSYLDYSHPVPIGEALIGEVSCVRAQIFKKMGEQRIRKGLSIFRAFATDGESDLTITIYNSRFSFAALEVGKTYHFYGKMQGTLLRREMQNPLFINPEKGSAIQAIYPLTEGLSSKMVSTNVAQALTLWGDRLDDPLPDAIRQEEELCHRRFAYENIHVPQDEHALTLAKQRLVFDELLTLQLGLLLLKSRQRDETAVQLLPTDLQPFYDALPFTLTDDQQKVIAEALEDMRGNEPMNRLVQGDVGSGKTMVACALAYALAKQGYQTAVMAPTEILAGQHAKTFADTLERFGIRTALLTGSLTAAQKRTLKERIADGRIAVVIGTHALIQDSVSFQNLGLVVTDEQHRFGVNQRALLAQKGENPHKLVMSATPIPRTLALIIYGDLDVSVIRHPPKGRLPIDTLFISGKKRARALHFVYEHLEAGEQAYLVCPLITPSEEEGSQLLSLEEYAESLQKTELAQKRIGILHGKQKPAEKDRIMLAFKRGELDLLLATTVVEVGVDVPNATIMMVENAENFGLSQLHQLRGRVGRGSRQSYCILVSDHRGEQTRERLKIMTRSSDGFEISEQDLKLRGPGDFFGSRQHGLPALRIANMVDDMQVLLHTQELARGILADDPKLSKAEHRGLRGMVDALFEQPTD